jgi:AraC-like DNA-binding protein
MRYVEFSPPADLGGVVDAFWIVEGGVGDRIRVVPDGCTDLIDAGTGSVWFNGPMTRAEIIELRAPVTRGVRLAPGTLLTLAGVAELRLLRDGGTPVTVPAWARGVDQSGRALARELLSSGVLLRDAGVDAVLAAFAAAPRRSLADIYARLGVHERQMQRLFDRYVGLSPKQTRQVLRHSGVARALRAGDGGLATLAAEYEYADQAHLSRDYRRLAGVSPGGYRREFDAVGFVQDDAARSLQNGSSPA